MIYLSNENIIMTHLLSLVCRRCATGDLCTGSFTKLTVLRTLTLQKPCNGVCMVKHKSIGI